MKLARSEGCFSASARLAPIGCDGITRGNTEVIDVEREGHDELAQIWITRIGNGKAHGCVEQSCMHPAMEDVIAIAEMIMERLGQCAGAIRPICDGKPEGFLK